VDSLVGTRRGTHLPWHDTALWGTLVRCMRCHYRPTHSSPFNGRRCNARARAARPSSACRCVRLARCEARPAWAAA
jgi:hypothetical protein